MDSSALPRPTGHSWKSKGKKQATPANQALASAGRAALFRAVSIDEAETPRMPLADGYAVSICGLDGSTRTLICRGANTIRSVKKRLQRREGTPWRLLLLHTTYGEEPLADEQTLQQLASEGRASQSADGHVELELCMFKDSNRFHRLKYVAETSTGGVWQDTLVTCRVDSTSGEEHPLQIRFDATGEGCSLTVTLTCFNQSLRWSDDSVYVSMPNSDISKLVKDGRGVRVQRWAEDTYFPWAGAGGAHAFREFATKLLSSLDLRADEWGTLMDLLDCTAFFGDLPVGVRFQPPAVEVADADAAAAAPAAGAGEEQRGGGAAVQPRRAVRRAHAVIAPLFRN